MTFRSASRLERLLHQGVFCVTSEVVPPKSSDPRPVKLQARGLQKLREWLFACQPGTNFG